MSAEEYARLQCRSFDLAMHALSPSWLVVIVAAAVVGIVALFWARRRPNVDLGSVSDTWIAEHVTDGRRS
jgi:hypothetical protein